MKSKPTLVSTPFILIHSIISRFNKKSTLFSAVSLLSLDFICTGTWKYWKWKPNTGTCPCCSYLWSAEITPRVYFDQINSQMKANTFWGPTSVETADQVASAAPCMPPVGIVVYLVVVLKVVSSHDLDEIFAYPVAAIRIFSGHEHEWIWCIRNLLHVEEEVWREGVELVRDPLLGFFRSGGLIKYS